MRKRFVLILLIAAGFAVNSGLFAQGSERPSFYIPYVKGSGISPGDNDFITHLIGMEAAAQSFLIMDTVWDADYTLTGTINQSYEGNAFFLGLRDNKSGTDILDQSIVFHSMDDITQLLPLMMFTVFSNIPNVAAPQVVVEPAALPPVPSAPPVPVAPPVRTAPSAPVGAVAPRPQVVYIREEAEEKPPEPAKIDDSWRNMKWYFGACGIWSPRIYVGDYDSVHASNFGGAFMADWNFIRLLSLGTGFEIARDWVVTQRDDYRDFVLDIPVSVKAVFRPASYFMLEPYAGVHFNISLTGTTKPSILSWLVGFQYGVKAGPGAVIIDSRLSVDVTESLLKTRAEYRRTLFRMAIGYKIGFFPR